MPFRFTKKNKNSLCFTDRNQYLLRRVPSWNGSGSCAWWKLYRRRNADAPTHSAAEWWWMSPVDSSSSQSAREGMRKLLVYLCSWGRCNRAILHTSQIAHCTTRKRERERERECVCVCVARENRDRQRKLCANEKLRTERGGGTWMHDKAEQARTSRRKQQQEKEQKQQISGWW
jgi:hypothetical protein